METALTIAGFDPSGGAGLQADLKVFHAFGIYGLSAVAALTAQNSREVKLTQPVDARFLRKQLTVLLADFTPDAVKTGMLWSEENVGIVAELAKRHSWKNLVVDPVIRSSSGKNLAARGTILAVRNKLFCLAAVVTPNLFEASVLSGISIKDRKDMERAAIRLKEFGPRAVIVTGGHLSCCAEDVVYDGTFHYLKSRKVAGEYHGTGCAFSAALAALLARGLSVPQAAKEAKKFVQGAFRGSFGTGKGMRLLNL